MQYKTLKRTDRPAVKGGKPQWKITNLPEIFFIILLLIWAFLPRWLQRTDPTAGTIDQSMWLLILIGMISFLLMLAICWWLLLHFWKKVGLPEFNSLILQFYHLTSWQQLSLFLASFFLLLLAATVCIAGIF